jgi:enoyl-CoA hydratase
MTETLVQDNDVIVSAHGALRQITLNRPKALNALTLDMAVRMTALLREWANDPAVGAILLDGAGDRAFCAGGDIRALYDGAKAGSSLPATFWATEYRLDMLIARYPKPVVVVMDGMVMGGGIGLSAYASHRVVTERSALAMPETGIGYFPDVGASFLLARSPGETGTYLAMTGERVGAADAIFCGLADTHIPAAKRAELATALADCRDAADVRHKLEALSAPQPPGKFANARSWIDACFGTDRVEEIFNRLAASKGGAAQAALETLQRVSPTSLKITLRNIREARTFKRPEQSFMQDYRLSLACASGHDFVEGIRAQIVDKDRNPSWQPPRLEDVTPAIVDRYFASIGERELQFSN